MATNEEIVAKAQQLYVSYYGRPADPEGLAFWIAKFLLADDVDQVLVDFGTSQEFLDFAAGKTDADLIDALYHQMFNRDADADGLAFYLEKLNTGDLSLASIALDIANGAQNDDITILDNKVDVANGFTDDVDSGSKAYSETHIPDAQAALAMVDVDQDSIDAGTAAGMMVTDSMPTIGGGGEFTLDENNQVGDYSAQTAGVTVTLDGDSDEAFFTVTGSPFDDSVILEEFGSADIDGGDGVDVLDTDPQGGTATVNLLAGTFSLLDGGDTFSGFISNVENLIGSDGDDTLTGDNGENWFWSGDGDDIIKGGLGDDYFVFEDEDQFQDPAAVTPGTIDGQTGDDTVIFTADAVDLSLIGEGDVAVENLMLTDVELEGEVTLVLEGAGGGHVSVDDFKMVTGSAGVDTISTGAAGDVTLAGTTLNSIEVVTSAAAGAVFSIDAALAGVALVASNVAVDADLMLISPTASATFDLGANSLTGFDSIAGQALSLSSIFETVKITQGILDSVLANAKANTTEAGVFVDLDESTLAGSDVLMLGGNVDFTGFTLEADVDVASIAYGNATTTLFGDLSATGVSSIAGSAGEADVLVITPGAGVVPMDMTGQAISDVENIIFDILTADFGADTVTIAESTFAGIDTINGEVNFLADVSAAGELAGASVDLSGVDVTDGFDLSSVAAADVITVSQGGIDGFKTLGGDGSAVIALAMADFNLDLSGASVAGAAALSLAGTAGDDAVVAEDTATLTTPATGRLALGGTAAYVLGAGNDTWSGAATSLDVGGGDNNITGQVFGAVTLTDGSPTGATDGNNLFVGSATGTVTGGFGSDTLIGIFTDGANALGAGDDSITGMGGAGATLGSGNDSFSTSATTFQLASANLSGVAGGHTSVDGGSGNDSLSTGILGDTLTGGVGNDLFTISGATFSPVFVGSGTAGTNLAGIAPTVTIGGAASTTTTNPNLAVLGTGVTLVDFNVGTLDTLNIDLLGTYTTGTKLTSNSAALSGTTTITTALAAARTENGGVRVLNGQGALVTIAENSAIGTTVALRIFTATGAVPTATVTGTGTGVTNTIGFLTWLYNTNIGGTGAGGIRASLADTTYVAFALTATLAGGPDLVAYLVTANATNTGTVAAAEVTAVTIASITASDGISAADIVLI